MKSFMIEHKIKRPQKMRSFFMNLFLGKVIVKSTRNYSRDRSNCLSSPEKSGVEEVDFSGSECG